MNTADVLPNKTTEFTHKEWHIIPNANHPNHFTLKTTTGTIICALAFPGNNNTTNATFLNLIASAPELQDIVEMYRDSMTGKEAEKTMVFAIVREILSRLQ